MDFSASFHHMQTNTRVLSLSYQSRCTTMPQCHKKCHFHWVSPLTALWPSLINKIMIVSYLICRREILWNYVHLHSSASKAGLKDFISSYNEGAYHELTNQLLIPEKNDTLCNIIKQGKIPANRKQIKSCHLFSVHFRIFLVFKEYKIFLEL